MLGALALQEWRVNLSCDPGLGSAWGPSSWVSWPELAREAKARCRGCWASMVAGLGPDSKGVLSTSHIVGAAGTDWYPFESYTLPTLSISPKEWSWKYKRTDAGNTEHGSTSRYKLVCLWPSRLAVPGSKHHRPGEAWGDKTSTHFLQF